MVQSVQHVLSPVFVDFCRNAVRAGSFVILQPLDSTGDLNGEMEDGLDQVYLATVEADR